MALPWASMLGALDAVYHFQDQSQHLQETVLHCVDLAALLALALEGIRGSTQHRYPQTDKTIGITKPC